MSAKDTTRREQGRQNEIRTKASIPLPSRRRNSDEAWQLTLGRKSDRAA